MSNFFMQPNETKTFSMDYLSQLTTGETIDSFDVSVIDTSNNEDVTVTAVTATQIVNSKLFVTVSNTTVNKLYKVTIVVTTSLGNDLEADVFITVAEDDPLILGVDTYVKVYEADIYINDNYASMSPEYVAWNSLAIKDKSVYLKKACKKIDRQMLRGIKALANQTLEFPRALKTEYYNLNYPNTTIRFTNDWVVEQEVTQNVKDAQCEEAIAILINGSNANKRLELQQQGVKSYSLGDLSETFSKVSVGGTKLLSFEARELLGYYLNGSVSIR